MKKIIKKTFAATLVLSLMFGLLANISFTNKSVAKVKKEDITLTKGQTLIMNGVEFEVVDPTKTNMTGTDGKAISGTLIRSKEPVGQSLFWSTSSDLVDGKRSDGKYGYDYEDSLLSNNIEAYYESVLKDGYSDYIMETTKVDSAYEYGDKDYYVWGNVSTGDNWKALNGVISLGANPGSDDYRGARLNKVHAFAPSAEELFKYYAEYREENNATILTNYYYDKATWTRSPQSCSDESKRYKYVYDTSSNFNGSGETPFKTGDLTLRSYTLNSMLNVIVWLNVNLEDAKLIDLGDDTYKVVDQRENIVSFLDKDENEIEGSTQSVSDASQIQFPEPPAYTNYSFVGWLGDKDKVSTEDVTFKAIYIKKNSKTFDNENLTLETNYNDASKLLTKYKKVNESEYIQGLPKDSGEYNIIVTGIEGEKFVPAIDETMDETGVQKGSSISFNVGDNIKIEEYTYQIADNSMTNMDTSGGMFILGNEITNFFFAPCVGDDIDTSAPSYMRPDMQRPNVYQGSNMQKNVVKYYNENCKADYGRYIIPTSKIEEAFTISIATYNKNTFIYRNLNATDAVGSILKNDYIFPVSVPELYKYVISKNDNTIPKITAIDESTVIHYWLRSPYVSTSTNEKTFGTVASNKLNWTTKPDINQKSRRTRLAMNVNLKNAYLIKTSDNNYTLVNSLYADYKSQSKIFEITPSKINATVSNAGGNAGSGSYSIEVKNVETVGGATPTIKYSTENSEIQPSDSTFTLDEPTKYSEKGEYTTWVRITADNHETFYAKGTVTIAEHLGTVTFLDKDGKEIDGSVQYVDSAEKIKYPVIPAYENYRFVGWLGDTSKVVEEDITLQAIYVKNTYTKSYDKTTISLETNYSDASKLITKYRKVGDTEYTEGLPTLAGEYEIRVTGIEGEVLTPFETEEEESKVQKGSEITFKKSSTPDASVGGYDGDRIIIGDATYQVMLNKTNMDNSTKGMFLLDDRLTAYKIVPPSGNGNNIYQGSTFQAKLIEDYEQNYKPNYGRYILPTTRTDEGYQNPYAIGVGSKYYTYRIASGKIGSELINDYIFPPSAKEIYDYARWGDNSTWRVYSYDGSGGKNYWLRSSAYNSDQYTFGCVDDNKMGRGQRPFTAEKYTRRAMNIDVDNAYLRYEGERKYDTITGVKTYTLMSEEYQDNKDNIGESIKASINKLDLTYNVAGNIEKEYDGKEAKIAVTVDGLTEGIDYEVIYSSSEESEEMAEVTSLTNVGELELYVRIKPLGEYANIYNSVGYGEGESPDPIHRTIKINKAQIDYTVSDNVEKVYDGVEESITVSVNNMSSDEYEVVISNEENSEVSGVSSLTNAGILNAYVRIRPIGDAAGNYYSVGFGEGESPNPIYRTIKINKAEMPWSVSDSVIRDYNGEEASINVSVDGFTSDMYEVIKADSEEATTSAEVTSLTNVGTVTLYIKIKPIGTAANNYYSVGFGEGVTTSAVQRVITINPANITATVKNDGGPYTGEGYCISVTDVVTKGNQEAHLYYSTIDSETRPDDSTFTLESAPIYEEAGSYNTWVKITADNHNSFYGKGTVIINNNPHKVTFLDIDGNEITGTSQEVLSANEIVYPNAAEVEGYKFLGWSGKESQIAVEDVTFKATYVKDLKTKYVVGDTIEVSIKPEDADINLTYSVINTAATGEVSNTLPTLPGSYTVTIKPEEKTSQSNIKLQAGTKASNPKFVSGVEYSFDITYKKVTWLGGFNSETVIEEQNYVTLPNSLSKAPSAPSVTGYTFLGYLGDISKAIEEEVEMKAIYVKTSVSKVYDGEEAVIDSNYEDDLTYNVALPSETGEYVIGVSVDDTGFWAQDIEVTVNIVDKLYTIRFLDKDGNELGDFAQEVRYKADIVLPEEKDVPEVEGYKFIGWYGYAELADELESDVLLQTMYIKLPDIQSIGKDMEDLDINIPDAEIVYTYYDAEGNILEGPPSVPGTYRVEATIMLNGKELTKTSFDVEFKNTQIPNIPIYRLYNPISGEHLFTSKVGEYNKLPKSGWVQEGMTFDAYAEDNKPEDAIEVYRLFNPMGFGGMGDHHYTKSKGEINKLVKAGWSLDFDGKPAFYVAGKISVFKLYDKRTGAHHYTPKTGERKNMEKAGWVYEGEAWTVNGYYSNNGTQRISDENM